MTRKIGCPCPSNCHRTLCYANPFGKADAKVHTFCKPTKYFNTFFEKNYDTLFIYMGKQGNENAFPKKASEMDSGMLLSHGDEDFSPWA